MPPHPNVRTGPADPPIKPYIVNGPLLVAPRYGRRRRQTCSATRDACCTASCPAETAARANSSRTGPPFRPNPIFAMPRPRRDGQHARCEAGPRHRWIPHGAAGRSGTRTVCRPTRDARQTGARTKRQGRGVAAIYGPGAAAARPVVGHPSLPGKLLSQFVATKRPLSQVRDTFLAAGSCRQRPCCLPRPAMLGSVSKPGLVGEESPDRVVFVVP